jgi:glycosyltransferase involved in cell wall biosynthesis
MVFFIKRGGELRRLLGVFEKPILKIKLSKYNNTQPTSKTRLLICPTWLQVGGVERVLLNLIEDLKKDFEIHIITSLPNQNLWEDEFKKYTFRILHLPKIASKKYHHWFISEYVKKAKIESILITNNIPAYQAIPAIKEYSPKIKIIDLLHTHGRPEDHDAFLPISLPYNDLMDKRIVISEYLKKYYCKNYPVKEQHVEVIYNSINNKMSIKPKTAKWDKLFKEAGNKKFIVSYIGRLTIDKSPLRLLEIAKALCIDRGYSNVIFAVAGDGPLKNEMQKIIKNWQLQKNIRMLGHINNPINLMGASDLTIITSDMEGIPLSALESMSVGTPVIATAVGGMPEIIDNDVDGFLIPMDNVDVSNKFADKIELVLKSKNFKEIQENTKKKVLRKFTSMGKQYSKLLVKAK